MNCQFCNKEANGKRGLVTHERTCKSNPNRKLPNLAKYKEENPQAWNKGLTKESSPGVAAQAEKTSVTMSGRTGRKHSDATKQKISVARSSNNKGGRCKWYEVNGVKVQGTWEKAVAVKLTELNIKWVKIGVNAPNALSYVMDNKHRHYSPDFYLPEHNVYLELKGFWWGDDKRKMDIVKATYPDLNIVIVEKAEYERILRGELVW